MGGKKSSGLQATEQAGMKNSEIGEAKPKKKKKTQDPKPPTLKLADHYKPEIEVGEGEKIIKVKTVKGTLIVSRRELISALSEVISERLSGNPAFKDVDISDPEEILDVFKDLKMVGAGPAVLDPFAYEGNNTVDESYIMEFNAEVPT